MIEHLKVGRAAYFYKRKKALSNRAINKLFAVLRQHAQKPTKNLFSAVRTQLGEARYSAICFSFDRQPSFLDKEAEVWERIYGFLLIVEKDDVVAVLKSGLDLPSNFKTDYLDKIEGKHVEVAIAQKAAVFEKLRLRNMSTSRLALRSKTLEANDLENSVPVSSASRFVPQAYTVRWPDGSNYSATPNTGRISNQSERAGVEDLVAWSSEVIDELRLEEGDTAAFIKNFARSTSLGEIPDAVHPTSLAFDVAALREAFYGENPQIRLVRKQGEQFFEVEEAAAAVVFNDLDVHYPIGRAGDDFPILSPDDDSTIGKVSIGKMRISLPGFSRPSLADLYVENIAGDAGGETKPKLLARFLDQEDTFILLFSDLSLAYINGALFQDEALLGGGATFLARLKVADSLAGTTSEKGPLAIGQTEFAQGSVFRVVVDQVAQDSNVLVCDDLGDEWADFIAVNTALDPPVVSFYHAKHGRRSLSASAFHESVGQAIKNLGRMTLPAEAMTAKYRGWRLKYRGQNVRSSIDRIVRGGTAADVKANIDALRMAPDLVKRVFIVTSSLSRTDVENVFRNAAAGTAPSAHFVQLYWLLMSYFSACTEVGVIGYVVCQP
jgi:hypothetical protein